MLRVYEIDKKKRPGQFPISLSHTHLFISLKRITKTINEQMREGIEEQRVPLNVHILLLGRLVCARMSKCVRIYSNATISLIENEINASFIHKCQHTFICMCLWQRVPWTMHTCTHINAQAHIHSASSTDSLH